MLDQSWLSAFLPVGRLEKNEYWSPLGAATLFNDDRVIWIVSAAHVVRSADGEISPLVKIRGGSSTSVDIGRLHRQLGLSWIYDEKNDLAASLFPINPEFEIKAVARTNCAVLADVLPSMVCLTLGCPHGIPGFDLTSPEPLLLDGIISGINRTTQRIYITAPTFPGNSGGPVLCVKQPFDPSGGLVVGRPTVFFGGVVLEYGVYRGKDPSCSKKDVSEQPEIPPLHLGVAAPADAVLALVESDIGKEQVEIARRCPAN